MSLMMDGQKRHGGFAAALQHLVLVSAQGGVEHQVDHAQHAVERGAHLVAHHGQELRLGVHRRARLLGLAHQAGLERLLLGDVLGDAGEGHLHGLAVGRVADVQAAAHVQRAHLAVAPADAKLVAVGGSPLTARTLQRRHDSSAVKGMKELEQVPIGDRLAGLAGTHLRDAPVGTDDRVEERGIPQQRVLVQPRGRAPDTQFADPERQLQTAARLLELREHLIGVVLGFAHCDLAQAALGDVPMDPDQAQVAGPCPPGRGKSLDPAYVPGLQVDRELVRDLPTTLLGENVRPDAFDIVGMEPRKDRRHIVVAVADAERLAYARIGPELAGRHVPFPEAHARGRQRDPEPRIGILELVLDQPLCRDVDGHADDAAQTAPIVVDRALARLDAAGHPVDNEFLVVRARRSRVLQFPVLGDEAVMQRLSEELPVGPSERVARGNAEYLLELRVQHPIAQAGILEEDHVRNGVQDDVEFVAGALDPAAACKLKNGQPHDADRTQCHPEPVQLDGGRLAKEIAGQAEEAAQHHRDGVAVDRTANGGGPGSAGVLARCRRHDSTDIQVGAKRRGRTRSGTGPQRRSRHDVLPVHRHPACT